MTSTAATSAFPGSPSRSPVAGAFVGLDHVGLNDDDEYVDDRERAVLVVALIEAGHRDRIVLSSNAIGVAKGQPDYDVPFSHVLSAFVPLLHSLGVSEADTRHILVDNPRTLLTVGV